MYADRIEAEERSVKTRIAGSTTLGSVRSMVSFKRTAGGAGVGLKGKGRSDLDDKWQHDLFEEVETFLSPTGGGDLRTMLANKQQTKMGTRLASRVGPTGIARNAITAATDLRSQLGAGRRKGGRPLVNRKMGVQSSAAVQAQKRLTVTLRNERGGMIEEEVDEEEYEEMEKPAVVRGGRGSLIVTTRNDEDDDMEMEEMPGQVPLQKRRTSSRGGQQNGVAAFLSSLGLSKYTSTFEAEEIDMPALKQMTEEDLKELGIPMGPRKKILQAS